MLDKTEIDALIGHMWILHLNERLVLDRIYEYTKGLLGRPDVPEGTTDEVKELARLSIKNVLPMVRDSFAQNLSVVGYRTATATDNAPGWAMWQRNRMDARQAEVYRPALTYGAAYVPVTPSLTRDRDTGMITAADANAGPTFRTKSPRQLLSVYDDPQLDEWPQYALETWISQADAKPRRMGLLYDEEYLYPLDLGAIPSLPIDPSHTYPIAIQRYGEPIPHGAMYNGEPVCPVVRFINDRDADDMIVGEIAPLLTDQQAINNVNFDRLIVSRFGAFPQKVISGWSGTPDEVLKASAMRVWAFEDPGVSAQSLAAANMDGYNSVLDEMVAAVAMKAQITPTHVGKLINLSAEALAAAEANEQRKIAAKRESFGESWEQVLRLGAEMSGDITSANDDAAEVVWRDTEARTFAAMVDGVTKLVACGIPIESLLTLVPGMTQQQIVGVQAAIRQKRTTDLVAGLRAAAAQAEQNPTVADLASRRQPQQQLPQSPQQQAPQNAVAS